MKQLTQLSDETLSDLPDLQLLLPPQSIPHPKDQDQIYMLNLSPRALGWLLLAHERNHNWGEIGREKIINGEFYVTLVLYVIYLYHNYTLTFSTISLNSRRSYFGRCVRKVNFYVLRRFCGNGWLRGGLLCVKIGCVYVSLVERMWVLCVSTHTLQL